MKRPLGALIEGAPDKTMRALEKLISEAKPSRMISVGDVVSRNMLRHGIVPQLMIVDNKIMRATVEPFETQAKKKMSVVNPPGTLTAETWTVVDNALKQKELVLIVVDGEEDLLTLVAVLRLPKGSLVVYGQPRKGIVVVKVDKIIKQKVSQIVRSMEPLPKA